MPKVGVLCEVCKTAAKQDLLNVADGRAENVFVSNGYHNWKKVLVSFKKHENSATHTFSIAQLEHKAASASVVSQLSTKFSTNDVRLVHLLSLTAQQTLLCKSNSLSWCAMWMKTSFHRKFYIL